MSSFFAQNIFLSTHEITIWHLKHCKSTLDLKEIDFRHPWPPELLLWNEFVAEFLAKLLKCWPVYALKGNWLSCHPNPSALMLPPYEALLSLINHLAPGPGSRFVRFQHSLLSARLDVSLHSEEINRHVSPIMSWVESAGEATCPAL